MLSSVFRSLLALGALGALACNDPPRAGAAASGSAAPPAASRATPGGPCKPGASAPCIDGCNSCSCSTEGHWACTEMACPR